MNILLAPFRLVWRLLTAILTTTGRLLTGLFGLALIMLGVIMSLSVVGAVAGIPLTILGFALVLRALF
jgi:hypothetical protein